MYTILMSADKSLIATVKTTIYQREKQVDKIQFLFPQTYEDIELKDCIILMKYVDQGNVSHAETLTVDEDLYKDMLRCEYTVSTDFTRFSGDIQIWVSFLKLNTENGIHEEVLHSGKSVVTIQPLADIYAFVPDESLQVIDRAMLQVEAKIRSMEALAEVYEENKADNIAKTVDDDDNIQIQLTANGVPIGDQVTVGNTGENGVEVTTFSQSEDSTDTDDTGDDVVEF